MYVVFSILQIMAEAGHNKAPGAAETPAAHGEVHGGHDAHAETPGIFAKIGYKLKDWLERVFVDEVKKVANDNAHKDDHEAPHAANDNAHSEPAPAAKTETVSAKLEVAKTETKEEEKEATTSVKVVGVTANKEGIGLTKAMQEKMKVKAGEKIHVMIAGADTVPMVVEDIDAKIYKAEMGEAVVTLHDETAKEKEVRISMTEVKIPKDGKSAETAPDLKLAA